MKKNIGLRKRLLINGLVMGFLGYFIVHPFSMVIMRFTDPMPHYSHDNIIKMSFSLDHLPMGIVFTILCIAIGIIHAFYIQNILEKEEALRELNAAETVHKVISNFIGDALNNILTIAHGNLLIYQSFDNLDKELKKGLDTAEKWINQTIQGARAYQNSSLLEGGSFESTTLKSLDSILRPLLSAKSLQTYCKEEFEIPSNVKIKFMYNPKQEGALNLEELPCVCGTEDRITTAFQETLINSIESYWDGTDFKSGEVVISTRKKDDNLIIDIKDDGMGMNSEELKIFQLPFYKIPCIKGSTRLGLGTYVALQAMKAGGGNIYFESTPNVGTTTSLLFKTGDG